MTLLNLGIRRIAPERTDDIGGSRVTRSDIHGIGRVRICRAQGSAGAGLEHGALAEETHGNGACKGQMDKGLRSLSSETNEKFEQALSHHEYLAKARHIVPKIDALTPKETKFSRTLG